MKLSKIPEYPTYLRLLVNLKKFIAQDDLETLKTKTLEVIELKVKEYTDV